MTEQLAPLGSAFDALQPSPPNDQTVPIEDSATSTNEHMLFGPGAYQNFDEYLAAFHLYMKELYGDRYDPRSKSYQAQARLEYYGTDITDSRGNTRRVMCNACEDMRWFVIHGNPPRKVEACTQCPDFQEKVEARRVSSLVVAGFERPGGPHSLKDFDPTRQPTPDGARDQAENALKYVTRWANNDHLRLVAVLGPTGVGKTHLVEGALDHCISEGRDVTYMEGSLFSHLMRPRSKKDEAGTDSQFQVRDRLMKTAWLILDEVGISHDPSGWLGSVYQEVINFRWQKGRPTLIAGNIGAIYGEQLTMDSKQQVILSAEDHLRNVVGDTVISRLSDGEIGRMCDLWSCNDLRPSNKSDGSQT